MRHATVGLRELLEISALVGVDIGPILLGKEIRENPVLPTLGQDDGTVHVVVEPPLEHAPPRSSALP